MYYRESFEYSPIKIFMNSNSADKITYRGDVTFNLRRNINLPNNVIGYVSRNELTIPNTQYNINSSNNSLTLIDIAAISETITIEEGNYTVSQLKEKLTTEFSNAVRVSFRGITVNYDDKTNKFTFDHTTTGALRFTSSSTINAVLGFESNTDINFVVSNIQTMFQEISILITQTLFFKNIQID